jgi:hypothetical protein
MNLENLLNPVQQLQLAQQLARVIGWGFGTLEIRIEKGCLKWFKPGRYIFNPVLERSGPAPDQPLAVLLGPWAEAFAFSLAALLGEGFGSLYIGVDHGRIQMIQVVPDVRVRTGNTGNIRVDSATALHP